MPQVSASWLQALFLDLAMVPGFVRQQPDLSEALDRAPTRVLVACVPKSGSTFISNVRSAAMGAEKQHWCARYGLNEQDLNLARMVATMHHPGVAQHHLRATEGNVDLARLFGLRIVVLTRNLFDVIPSALDHARNESLVWPGVHLPADFRDGSEEAQVDLLIDHMVPWYVQFHVSWQQAFHSANLPIVWATYEDLVEDETVFLTELLTVLGLPEAAARVPDALTAVRGGTNRLNVGRTGRGLDLLSAEQQRRIAQIVGRYPSVDFSHLGLPADGVS